MSNNNLALLAAAAYGKFHNLNNKDEIQDNLKIENLSESQARSFTDTYDIIVHQSNTANGY